MVSIHCCGYGPRGHTKSSRFLSLHDITEAAFLYNILVASQFSSPSSSFSISTASALQMWLSTRGHLICLLVRKHCPSPVVHVAPSLLHFSQFPPPRKNRYTVPLVFPVHQTSLRIQHIICRHFKAIPPAVTLSSPHPFLLFTETTP